MEVFERYTLRDNESKISKYCHRNVTIAAKMLVQKTLEQIGLEVVDIRGESVCFSRFEIHEIFEHP